MWAAWPRTQPPRMTITSRKVSHGSAWGLVWYGMVWYGMAEVCEGAPVAVSGWVLTDRHDLAPCAASSLHRGTIGCMGLVRMLELALSCWCTRRCVARAAHQVVGYMGCPSVPWPQQPTASVLYATMSGLSSQRGLSFCWVLVRHQHVHPCLTHMP